MSSTVETSPRGGRNTQRRRENEVGGIEGSKLVDTIALMQLAFSFATFAFFAAKTSESIKVVWRRVGRRFLHDLHVLHG